MGLKQHDMMMRVGMSRQQYQTLHGRKVGYLAGIDIPEIKLVDLDKLDNLPPINLPEERQAFAIKRFDRDGRRRIHMEDFAQILVKYPHDKYNSASYEQIGRVVYDYSGEGLADAQQFARRDAMAGNQAPSG